MKLLIAFLVCFLLLGIPCCSWDIEEDETRKTSCIQRGLYDYLEDEWIDSICISEICSTYTSVWKELFIQRNNMTEEYFDKHITVISSETTPLDRENVRFHLVFRVKNEWAIAESGAGFLIKIAEDETDYPEIGLPRGTYLTLEEVDKVIDPPGFNSWIGKAPKTGPLRYSSMNEALDKLIESACVDTMCFNRVFLSRHIGTLTMEAYAVYEDEENGCIIGTIDLITGKISVYDVLCDKI